MIPLSWYLILAALLFCIGLFGVLARKSAVAVLMSIELMLNAVNINLLAFWRYLHLTNLTYNGFVFVVILFAVAAAETAVGLAIIISAYRSRKSVAAEEFTAMQG